MTIILQKILFLKIQFNILYIGNIIYYISVQVFQLFDYIIARNLSYTSKYRWYIIRYFLLILGKPFTINILKSFLFQHWTKIAIKTVGQGNNKQVQTHLWTCPKDQTKRQINGLPYYREKAAMRHVREDGSFTPIYGCPA